LKNSSLIKFGQSHLWLLLAIVMMGACQSRNTSQENTTQTPITMDVHSYARPNDAIVKHISLNLNVDFAAKILSGSSTLTIGTQPESRKLFLEVM
jgi:hypothetical protein